MVVDVVAVEPETTPSEASSSEIPTEIVSDEEMALIDAALSFAFAARSSTFIRAPRNSTSITAVNLLSKRDESTSYCVGDIEDGIGNGFGNGNGRAHKKKKVNESLLHRFRRKTGLFVTDITSAEWCEKQKEFYLLCGTPKATKAMKAGSARHAVLEEEVITRVEVLIRSAEEHWALKMINFIHGTTQLLCEGLTRELPLIGFVEGVCIVGIIDEIQMTTITESKRVPTVVETKTRSQDNLPSEPQQRNGRLQLMCYKYLWDNLIVNPFPSVRFLELFSLNPNYVLSNEIQESAIQAGIDPAPTLGDVIRKYQYVCSILPETHNQLLLRYEYQRDQSLISEDHYLYDSDWVTGQIRFSLEFWKGAREASYAPEDERWKCRRCKYASKCLVNAKPEEATTQTTKVENDIST